MLYKEIKKVLADPIVEITLTKEALPTSRYKINFSAEEKLVDAVNMVDRLSVLDDYEVISVYSVKGGFAIEFEFDSVLAKTCETIGTLFLRV